MLTKCMLWIMAAIILIGGLLLLYFNNPESTFWMPICPTEEVFSIYCPGCGTGRGLYALLHGDLAGSLRKNILLLPAIIMVIVLYVKPKLACNVYVAYGLLTIFVLYMILRNIPCEPFIRLAPH